MPTPLALRVLRLPTGTMWALASSDRTPPVFSWRSCILPGAADLILCALSVCLHGRLQSGATLVTSGYTA
eukprot:8832544-Pyramimonas_sp.AAC.1